LGITFEFMKNSKRPVELIVISDTHLGTVGARAQELHRYLKSIQPKTIVLNGDIVDLWQFSKRHWNKYHTKVIKQLLKFISNGVKVHYIAGNHDEALRRFLNFELEGFKITNKLSLDLDGKKTWFFHGDVFDVTMQHSRWLTRLGGFGYDLLILINSTVNKFLTLFGSEKLSFSKTIKNKVKAAVSYINSFETTVVDIAIRNNFDYVVCGHIHQPVIKTIELNSKRVVYLNSGDWIENMTALEYNNKEWTLFQYDSDAFKLSDPEDHEYKDAKALFSDLVADINPNFSNS